MGGQQMKFFKFLISAALVLVITVSTSFGWGYITHAYFANSLGAANDPANANEIYGSVLTDAFNTIYTPQGQYMYEMLHHQFEPFVNSAFNPDLKSIAYGVQLHNDTNGADFTAHHNAFTLGEEGFAVYWGNMLAPSISPDVAQLFINAGLDPQTSNYIAAEASPLLGHIMVEDAVDLLIKNNIDPQIGSKLKAAARARTDETPILLADVYSPGLAALAGISLEEAERFIVKNEVAHQHLIIRYGTIFGMRNGNDIKALSMIDAKMGEAYLEAASGVDISVPPDMVTTFLMLAINLVQPTYKSELAQTLEYLKATFPAPSAIVAGEKLDIRQAAKINGFKLKANFPNPFNPSTTIPYALSSESYVTLQIYNSLGQEVACLVNETQDAGEYSVMWNAAELSGGIYFCRLSTNTGTALMKLMLVK